MIIRRQRECLELADDTSCENFEVEHGSIVNITRHRDDGGDANRTNTTR